MKTQRQSRVIAPENSPTPGVYRHYKGPLYEVIGMAQHSETDEWMVHYQALYGDFGYWLRPLSLWNEPVTPATEETKTPLRFTPVT